jgi:type II secretory pathway pseudopilin PulG
MEVVIVMAIIAVLLGVGIPTMLGSKRNARTHVVANTATSYAHAIEAFQLDHRMRPPAIGDPDWTKVAAGPIDLQGTAYLKQVPEVVSDGRVQLIPDNGGGGAAPKGLYGRLRYRVSGPAQWTIFVDTVDTTGYVLHCQVSNNASGTTC